VYRKSITDGICMVMLVIFEESVTVFCHLKTFKNHLKDI
jgi:uncharacterized membrane protein YcfT